MLNKSTIKFYFGLWIAGYTIALCFSLVTGFSGKRIIGVEQHRLAGVIFVKGSKLPVHGTTVFAEVPVHAKNIIEYLLLTNKERGNFLSELLRLAMWLYGLLMLWKINLKDPFDYESFIAAKRIGTLFVLAFIADLAGSMYTNTWFENLYHTSAADFQYAKIEFGLGSIVVPAMVVSTIIAFYRIATYNQQEQELTV